MLTSDELREKESPGGLWSMADAMDRVRAAEARYTGMVESPEKL